jgi:hypothetical protein
MTFIHKKYLGMSIVFPYLSLYLITGFPGNFLMSIRSYEQLPGKCSQLNSQIRRIAMMNKRSLILLLMLLLGVTACASTPAEDPLAAVEEPGVVTVFKTPT